jgi:hypothetical protein
MEDYKPYLVEFSAQLDDRGRNALSAAGITLTGSSNRQRPAPSRPEG